MTNRFVAMWGLAKGQVWGPVVVSCAVAGGWTLGTAPAVAQAQPVDSVVVTGSARAARTLDLPFAVTAIDAQALRSGGPMVNLSEALVQVPGLVVNNRNNYAQDLQISSRGFGARAGFGVRGLRMYTDGLPATMPDGQGQVAHFDLAGAQRIEVLRGPFSVLYGNSSGGVIALFSAPARERQVELSADLGSFGLRQLRGAVAAPLGSGFDLRASLSAMETDGFRAQSSADRQLANVRLGWQGATDRVVLLLSNHDQRAQDPLGLTPEAWSADPRSTARVALEGYDATVPTDLLYNTRKTIRQTQGGLRWVHDFGDSSALKESALSVYGGSRGVTQFLAIPPTTQRGTNPAVLFWQRHGGGVVDFDRTYNGADGRLQFGWTGVDLAIGLTVERQTDERRGFENFTGGPAAPSALGVVGEPRRDETNRATSRDAYAQLDWALTPTVSATAGLRSGRVAVDVSDRYVGGLNLDDSGNLAYTYTNPVLGLRWRVQPAWSLHASVARGFESPTLGELAYSADNSGFNRTLLGQTSRQLEVGSKWRGNQVSVDGALFAVDTHNEIGVRTNTGGRSAFQNVGRTRRYGAELSTAWRPAAGWRLQAAATVLHAAYRDGFSTCTAAPCPSTANPAVPVDAGNRIAGTQRATASAELAWLPGWMPGEWALEARGQARTAANDTNGVFAPGFGLVNLRWQHTWALGAAGELQTLLRVDNLADRAYVGSVIVNDGNRRFFEPGAPRSALVSLRWRHGF